MFTRSEDDAARRRRTEESLTGALRRRRRHPGIARVPAEGAREEHLAARGAAPFVVLGPLPAAVRGVRGGPAARRRRSRGLGILRGGRCGGGPRGPRGPRGVPPGALARFGEEEVVEAAVREAPQIERDAPARRRPRGASEKRLEILDGPQRRRQRVVVRADEHEAAVDDGGPLGRRRRRHAPENAAATVVLGRRRPRAASFCCRSGRPARDDEESRVAAQPCAFFRRSRQR
mmetsp:Transcript_11220/g.45433  ORF Transcript_11220/g.45433 Transcript_11220/m.45433 type:complete len:232 (-) Transcript_11220:602-1297(-)